MFLECSLNVCLFAGEGPRLEERRRVAEKAERERAQEEARRSRVAEVRTHHNSMHVYTIPQRPDSVNNWRDSVNNWCDSMNSRRDSVNNWPDSVNDWPDSVNDWPDSRPARRPFPLVSLAPKLTPD
jgi:hypothetical protein